MLEGKLDVNKVVTYVLIMLLGGSEAWQYLDFQDKIHRDTKQNTQVEFVNNVDSLRKVISNEEFAKGVFNEGVMAYKDFNSSEAERYMIDVLRVADEAMANDSFYTYVEKPMLIWLSENKKHLEHLFKYQYLTPMKQRNNEQLFFQWVDGTYTINERNVNGALLRSWRDREDDLHHLQSISKIKDN